MAQVDKIQVSSTTYNIAPATAATFSATSSDASSATSWTSVDTLASGETTASIFGKISKMFKNIRYLYGRMGTTDISGVGSTATAAIAALNTGKADATHYHKFGSTIQDASGNTVSLSNAQVNDDVHVPTSSLIYSMNSTLTSLNDAYLYSGSSANNRFEYKSLGAWSSSSTVGSFLSEYTHDNDYRGNSHTPLSLGNYVTINDGTYNVDWMIAGFDTEYQNGDAVSGYGITMIPLTYVTTGYMNSTNTTSDGYYGSYMNSTTLPAIATKLKNALGSYLKERRVLLTNSVNTSQRSAGGPWNGCSNGWSFYSEYLTLMSEVQVYGSTVFSSSGYDTGEAKEKLPIFNFINPNHSRTNFWLRGVSSSTYFCYSRDIGYAHYLGASNVFGVRPLMYIGA